MVVAIDVRGGGVGGAQPPGLKNFRANSVFRVSTSCSKILEDKKYFNTVKNSWATLFFKVRASCSQILNDKKSIFNTVKNSRATLFFRASASCSKILNDKICFNTVKDSRATLFFRASASYSKILNDKTYILNRVKNSRENFVFQGKRKLLENPE